MATKNTKKSPPVPKKTKEELLKIAKKKEKKERRKQILLAISKTIRQIWATCIGGVAPVISYDVAHKQARENPWLWCIVAGLLAYSAPSVNDYLSKYIDNRWKTWGFVLAIETAMTFTEGWTSYVALGMMVSINAIVLGKVLQTPLPPKEEYLV